MTIASPVFATNYNFTYAPDGSTQNWSTASDWSTAVPSVGGTTTDNISIFVGATNFTNTSPTTLLINDDRGSGSPSTSNLNVLSLNGKGSVTVGATVTVTLEGATLAFGGSSPTVNLNSFNPASGSSNGFSLVVQNNILLNANLLFTGTGNAQLFNFSGAIGDGGAGLGITKSGTKILTLSGASTYTGTTVLNGGEISLNSTETPGTSGPMGNGGPISFTGGALQYSAVDTSDYSSRFSTAAGQLYNIDTNGQTVAFGTSLTSSGGSLTKQGLGTLTLSTANTFSGSTLLQGGTLEASAANGLGTGTVTVLSASTSGTYSPTLKLDNVGGLGSSQTLVLTDNSAAVAKANLNYSGTDTIFSLIHDGVTEPVGVYGAGGTTETWLTGTGSLTVTNAPEPHALGLLGSGMIGLLLRRRRARIG